MKRNSFRRQLYIYTYTPAIHIHASAHTHILVPWFIIFEGVSLSLKSVYNKTYAISLSAGRERKQRHREKTFNWQPGDYYNYHTGYYYYYCWP